MEFTKPQILNNKIECLDAYRFSDREELNIWQTRDGFYAAPGEYCINSQEWVNICIGDRWRCGVGGTQWFRREVVIPKRFAGCPVILDLNFGGEGLVRINGEIRSGISCFKNIKGATRTRVWITDCATGDETLTVEIEAEINYLEFFYFDGPNHTEAEYQISSAFLAVPNKMMEEYYFDVKTAYDAFTVLQDEYLHDRVRNAVLASLTAVDFDFEQDTLYKSIPRAKQILQDGLNSISHTAHANIKFVGQAHIDTAWLWPLKESVRKCGKTMANVLDLMDRYPEFIFAFSQPQLFKYTKDNYPSLYDKIKKRVAEGRLELVGNTWVEMDTNIPSGESLVRQLLYGKAFFQQEFGQTSSVFWMPDVFGYSWALPQIIKRSGMEYFFTSKLVNNDTNRFPHSLFMWQGIDGTKILSYLQRLNYNGDYCPDCVESIYRQFDQKSVTNEILMTFGYGDGGGGPSYQMLETGRRLANFPGLQKTEIATAASFFENAATDNLPVWNDEMYYEFHRGTYTSQAKTKRNNRKAEFLYRRAEMAAAISSSQLGTKYPYASLLEGYQLILTNQFHDIIPGSSIKDVYRDCEKDYARAFSIGHSVEDEALLALASDIIHDENSILIFNPLSWERTEPVTILLKEWTDFDFIITNMAGDTLPSKTEKTSDGILLTFITTALPFGWTVCLIIKGHSNNKPIKTDNTCFENEYYVLKLDTDGNISSLFDKENNCEVFAKTSNQFQLFEDKPGRESAWNVELEYQNKMWALDQAESVELLEQNEVRQVIRVIRRFNRSSIRQDIIFYHDMKRIDFETHVDWHETERMLKVAFYPDVLTSKATYEIQFGSIERPTHWNTSYDKSKFEVCGHKWADLSEGGYGVSLLNDCKYGYDTHDNQLRLTLLRAPVDPDPTADRGEHIFTYSLYPHMGDWRQGKTVQQGYNLNQPLIAVWIPKKGGLSEGSSYISIDQQNVVLDTLKCAEDENGLIVRLYEAHGARGMVNMHLNFNIKQVYECNLMEENELEYSYQNGSFSFFIKPYEIKTFRLIK